ncbi:MAG: 4Fe-4S dicluster domain-containing protein [Chloroflexota bacterium]
MQTLMTTRKSLSSWLDDLIARYPVIAPRHRQGGPLFEPITAADQVAWDVLRTVVSPKTWLFPATEVLLEIDKRPDGVTLSEPSSGGEQVLFAVRPCDARAFRSLDAMLVEHAPSDSYYARRRQQTALIGLACRQPLPDCFCASTGGAPDDPQHMDVMLYETDEGYLVQAVTGQGAALLEGLDAREVDATPPPPGAFETRVSLPQPAAWPAHFDDAYWARLAERCLSCRICTYVCPTCRCFDVRDAVVAAGPEGTHVQRLRAWDACLAQTYRRAAGGHDPRPLKAQRLRNRFYCKFLYAPQDFGAVGCVGCGRCIAACPVNIDISEVLADIARLEKHP